MTDQPTQPIQSRHGKAEASLLDDNLYLNVRRPTGSRDCQQMFDLTVRDGHDIGMALREVLRLESSQPTAADLPDGSIVAAENVVYIKNHPTEWSQWRGTNAGHFGDWRINEELANGARVLRVGYDKEG